MYNRMNETQIKNKISHLQRDEIYVPLACALEDFIML